MGFRIKFLVLGTLNSERLGEKAVNRVARPAAAWLSASVFLSREEIHWEVKSEMRRFGVLDPQIRVEGVNDLDRSDRCKHVPLNLGLRKVNHVTTAGLKS